jgi:hypothetical protein
MAKTPQTRLIKKASDWGEFTRLKYSNYIEVRTRQDLKAQQQHKKAQALKYRQELSLQIKAKNKPESSEEKLPSVTIQQIAIADKLHKQQREVTFYKQAQAEHAKLKAEQTKLRHLQEQQDAESVKLLEIKRMQTDKEYWARAGLLKERTLEEQRKAVVSKALRKRRRMLASREAAEKHIEHEITRHDKSFEEDARRKNELIVKAVGQFARQVSPAVSLVNAQLPSSKLYQQTLDAQLIHKRKAAKAQRQKEKQEGQEIKLKADEEVREALYKVRRAHAKSLEIRHDLDKQVKQKQLRRIAESRLNSRELSFQRSWIESLYSRPGTKTPLDTSNFF